MTKKLFGKYLTLCNLEAKASRILRKSHHCFARNGMLQAQRFRKLILPFEMWTNL